MNHTDVINELAKMIGAKSYIEIGVHRGHNIQAIKVPYKIGVDPDKTSAATVKMTSDDFFSVSKESFDLQFIDGLHEAQQVKRDFDNCLKRLNDGGLIVLHDTNPEAENLTHVPRDKKGRWLGDVYKFIVRLNEYEGIDFRTLEFDNGITVVWRGDSSTLKVEREVTWEYFDKNRYLLRPCSWEDLKIIINQLKQAA